jgi:hypothetical protein
MSISNELRAVSYLTKVFGGRKVFPNPVGHEAGFYHFVESRYGSYYSKIAHLSNVNGVAAIVDVTGDSDRIMIQLN